MLLVGFGTGFKLGVVIINTVGLEAGLGLGSTISGMNVGSKAGSGVLETNMGARVGFEITVGATNGDGGDVTTGARTGIGVGFIILIGSDTGTGTLPIGGVGGLGPLLQPLKQSRTAHRSVLKLLQSYIT